jgi:hypothetical protein
MKLQQQLQQQNLAAFPKSTIEKIQYIIMAQSPYPKSTFGGINKALFLF